MFNIFKEVKSLKSRVEALEAAATELQAKLIELHPVTMAKPEEELVKQVKARKVKSKPKAQA